MRLKGITGYDISYDVDFPLKNNSCIITNVPLFY